MKTTSTCTFRLTVIAASLSLGFGSAYGEDNEARANALRQDLATPDSRIAAGVGYVSKDNRQFGMYNGLAREGGYGLLDLDLIRRDDSTGTWLKLRGRNLGLDDREMRFDHERQGDWSYFIEGSQLSRREPNIVNTGLQGLGSTTQFISSTASKRDVDLSMDHEVIGVGARKFMIGGWDVRASFRQDKKDGARLFSHYQVYESGVSRRPGILFDTEPIDRTTRQWEVIANYVDRKFQLTGGYSGSSFDNGAKKINVDGIDSAGGPILGLPTTVALPQSNEAHQFHLAGGYNFSDLTRGTFKVSRSVATQDDDFALTPNLSSRRSLDGKVVTTLAFADLTTRPSDRLDVSASLRYEDRDDQTPTSQYMTSWGPAPTAFQPWSSIPSNPAINIPVFGSPLPYPPPNDVSYANVTPFLHAGYTGRNIPRSLTVTKGAVEAGYRLDGGYRLVGSLDYEATKHNVPQPYRSIAYREKTDETTARLELKRNLSETLNGSIAYSYSDRGGSDYVNDTYDPGADSNKINPLIWADRKRQKIRLLGDWLPDEQWSVQFIADYSEDEYSGRTVGPRKGIGQFLSADATYTINDKWKLVGWLSQERNKTEQTSRTTLNYIVVPGPDPSYSNIYWEADLHNITTAWGISLKGKPMVKLEVGADLSSSTDTSESDMHAIGGTGTAGVSSLPNYYYRQTSLKLFADYALEANSGIRGDYIFDHRRNNDWTWQNWTYGNGSTDGTTVTQPTLENTNFVGVSYYYRWR